MYQLLEKKKPYNKYHFYIRFQDERYRKNVSCPASVVNHLYTEWIQKITTETISKKVYTLKSTMDEYFNSIHLTKSDLEQYKEKLYLPRLLNYFGDVNILSINKNKAIQCAFSHKKKYPMAVGTFNRVIGLWSRFFNWLTENDYYVGNNPFKKTKTKRP